ncbi:Hypothetical protein NCS54_00490200 [Fusarium falciforme]|uniref:Hypothetical protein n=1 Tax=Fusarium falciforme TaxID=195108 RepID=UPI002300BA0C|nr:Hypothetical protein NCS54_00490200 [Fusarium falciforme]WAO87588.1 Hypothetical protein NCS54_00490200 [Fusarium falciforme]
MHRIGINVVDLSRAIGEAFAVIHVDYNRVGTEGLNMADNMLEPEVRKFIPSPLNSPTLYKIFKDAYIEHAKKSLGDECSPLPCNVMKHYERLAARQLL